MESTLAHCDWHRFFHGLLFFCRIAICHVLKDSSPKPRVPRVYITETNVNYGNKNDTLTHSLHQTAPAISEFISPDDLNALQLHKNNRVGNHLYYWTPYFFFPIQHTCTIYWVPDTMTESRHTKVLVLKKLNSSEGDKQIDTELSQILNVEIASRTRFSPRFPCTSLPIPFQSIAFASSSPFVFPGTSGMFSASVSPHPFTLSLSVHSREPCTDEFQMMFSSHLHLHVSSTPHWMGSTSPFYKTHSLAIWPIWWLMPSVLVAPLLVTNGCYRLTWRPTQEPSSMTSCP